ncbi:hypothetical protein [Candidatus Nitrososphaera evergladensis]|nr:hypothetical protein [Candidatus Nitrososphaera evergladensis]
MVPATLDGERASAAKKPFSLAEHMNSQFEKHIKPIEEFQKTLNRIQRLRGIEGFSASIPIQPAAFPIHYSPVKTVGIEGTICDKCFTIVLTHIPHSPRPEEFQLPIESSHGCKGEREFPSKIAREDEKLLVQEKMVNKLFEEVKMWLKDKEIVLEVEKLEDDYTPHSSASVITYKPESADLDLLAREACTMPINDEELKSFLKDAHSTIGIYKEVAKDSEINHYYRLSIQGKAREEPPTTGDAATGAGNNTTTTNATAAIASASNGTPENKWEEHKKATTATLKEKQQEATDDPSSGGGSSKTSNETTKTAAEATTSPKFGGIDLVVCNECCNPYVIPIFIPRNPELEKLFHYQCPGKAMFESEEARLERVRKSEADGVQLLFEAARICMPEGKIALAVTKIEPRNPSLAKYAIQHDGKDPGHYLSRAAKDGIASLDENELRDFLAHNKSTYGYYEIPSNGEQYFAAIIQNQTKEANATKSLPGDREVTTTSTTKEANRVPNKDMKSEQGELL